MHIPKSSKLLAEEASSQERSMDFPIHEQDKVIKIKPINCFNDWIIVIPLVRETKIVLPANVSPTNQGIVVGVGCGLPDSAGGRINSQVSIGDVVVFQERSTVMAISPTSGVYAGKNLLVLSERNLICKLDLLISHVVENESSVVF